MKGKKTKQQRQQEDKDRFRQGRRHTGKKFKKKRKF